MKTSSASKKVLASALSAAMVVAFAPTVAFGAIADKTDVTVSFDVNGGSIKDTHIASIPSEDVTVAGGKITLKSTYGQLANKSDELTKGGATFKGWFFDADGDGAFNDKKGDVAVNSNELVVTGDKISGTAVTLKAMYNEAVLTPTLGINEAAAKYTNPTSATVAATNLTASTQYIAKLALPGGKTVNSKYVETGASETEKTFSFDLSKLTAADFVKGAYTFTVEKAAGGVVATKVVNVVTVSLDAGAGYGTFKSDDKTSYLVEAGTKFSALANLTVPTGAAGSYSFVTYANEEGKTLDQLASKEIKADTKLVATYENPQVSAASAAVSDFAKGAGTLTFTAAHLPSSAKIKQYDATVTGPNGFSKVIEGIDTTKTNTLTFGAKYEAEAAVKDKLTAGTYTVSIAPVMNKDQVLENDEKFVVATKSVTMAAVTVDLNGGKWKADAAGATTIADAVAALPNLWQAGTELDTIAIAAISGNIEPASELQSFKKWQIDGKNIDAADVNKTVGKDGITVKATYEDSYIAAPQVAFAVAEDGKVTMTAAAAAGTKLYYDIASTAGTTATKPMPNDGKLTLVPGTDKFVMVKASNGKSSSKVVAYESNAKRADDFGKAAQDIMNLETSASTKNAPVRYGDALKTLKSDGVAALKAMGYATVAEWDKAVVAQYSSVLDAVAGIEKANIEAAKAFVKSADGKTYTYVSESDATKAVAAVSKVVAAYAENNNGDATYVTVNGAASNKTVADKLTISDYVNAAKAAAAAKTVSTAAAADAEAAIAVNDAIAKLPAEVTAANAKEAKAAAEAVVKAYGELSKDAKALVSSADYAKAVATIEAADAAVKDADKAAIAKVKGKTVKAKAKKATKSSLKVVKSESGAKSTFAKTSGNSKVKVYKSGKIVVKKGLKAGKKYTVKVKATVGASTKTVKVIVKVAK